MNWCRVSVRNVHESLHAESVIKALKNAVSERKIDQRLIHYSDRGAQYCSDLYQRLHIKHGITCSMTDGYDCYQNAMAERVNGILKMEFLLHRPKDLAQARKMVDESVGIYNNEGPHLALKYKTPDAVHRAFCAVTQPRLFQRQALNCIRQGVLSPRPVVLQRCWSRRFQPQLRSQRPEPSQALLRAGCRRRR